MPKNNILEEKIEEIKQEFRNLPSTNLTTEEWLDKMLRQFASDITELILVEVLEEAEMSFAPYESNELRAEGWNNCLEAIKAKRDRLLKSLKK